MISLLICSRIDGNENWGLPKLLKGLKEMSSNPRNFEVLIKFDTEDTGVPEVLPTLKDYPFAVRHLIEPRGRGYIDIHIGYTRLMSIANPRSRVMGAFADDFVITAQGWDEIVLSHTRKVPDQIYMIHQRPHPPYYRANYGTEAFYMDFSLDHLDSIEIIDEGPFWSRRLLEICGGLGHVSFTDAWTLCLEWYLFHHYGINRTFFLREPVIHRTLHEKIDTQKAARWSTDRLANFNFIKSDFYHTMVERQAGNISLNITAEGKITGGKIRDRISLTKENREPDLLQRLLETAQGALAYGRVEPAVLEFSRAVDEFPDSAAAHHGLGTALLAQSRIDEATAAFRRAVELGADQPDFHNDLGVALYQGGYLGEAEEAILEELRLFPESVDGQINLIEVYRRQGRLSEAISRIEKLAALAPRGAGVMNLLRSITCELTQKYTQGIPQNVVHPTGVHPGSNKTGPMLSIIIPSLRENQLHHCVDRIEEGTKTLDYEIVVVSPFPVNRPRVKHVQESESKGSCHAYKEGYQAACGEYIVALADDTYVTSGWASNMLAFMRLHAGDLFLGNFRAFDVKGERTEPGVYGKLYSCFPFVKREWIESLGGFYDTCFHSYYGDPDLSMRVWHHGGKVATCPTAWIEFANVEDEVETYRKTHFFERDQEVFFQRWHRLYGHLAKSRSFSEVQLPVADQISKRFPAQPPEVCARIYQAILSKDWKALGSLISQEHPDLCVSEYGLRAVAQRASCLRSCMDRANHQRFRLWLQEHRIEDDKPGAADAQSPTKLRVLLLAPSYDNNRFGLPPYNIAYLANYLKGRSDIELQIVNGDEHELGLLRQLIARSDYDVFATGGMITLSSYFRSVFTTSLQQSPGAWRVLGGPITSADLRHIFKTIPLDVAVLGEGEETFAQLLDLYLKQKGEGTSPGPKEYGCIDGIAFVCEDGEVKKTKPRTPFDLSKKDLRPAWEHFDVERYTRWNPLGFYVDLPCDTPQRQFSILIGRGCPFSCSFCGSPFGRKVRARPAKQVLKEIEDLHDRYRINVLYMMSETFFFKKEQILDFCRQLKERRLGMRWICNLRVDMVDEEIAHAMKQAGCDHITYGIESGSDRILKLMNKRATVEQNIAALEVTRRARIYPGGAIMFGYLDETVEEMRRTVDLMLENDHVPRSASIATAIPGTPLYTQARERGLIKDEEAYLNRLDGRIDVCDEPKANLSQIPDAVFWPTVVSEYRRLMTGLFRKGTARLVKANNGSSLSFGLQCPFCGEDISAPIPAAPIPLGTRFLCRKCRRIVWVDPFNLPASQTQGRALSAFVQRIAEEDATYGYVGYNNNSRWLLQLDLWNLNPGRLTGLFDLRRDAQPRREYLASVLPASEIPRLKPEYLFVTQHEGEDRITDALVQAGYKREQIISLYPLNPAKEEAVQGFTISTRVEPKPFSSAARLFAAGNYAGTVQAGGRDEWRTYAAMGLIGKTREAIEGLSQFDHPGARFYSAVASWIDGDESRAVSLLKEVPIPHAQKLLALIQKPEIRVLSQLPWNRKAPWDLLTAAGGDGRFKVRNISFHPEDLTNQPYADIRKFYDPSQPPDFYICAMIEWHLIPPNLQQLPCPIFGQTGDYDLHIQSVYPWLQIFDELIVTDPTEWKDVRRLVKAPVSAFPKSFGVADNLPPIPTAPREIDVFVSGSVTHPYWHEKSTLLHQTLRMPDATMLVIQGFADPETYQLMVGHSKVTFTHLRHPGAMPTRALEALSLGCSVVVQKDSVLTLYVGEEQGVLTYDFEKKDIAQVIRRITSKWSEFEQRARQGGAIIRREFALSKVASQYLRFLTFLAAKPRGPRQLRFVEGLAQKRSTLRRGWLPGAPPVLQKMQQQNLIRWQGKMAKENSPSLFIDMARELILEYATAGIFKDSSKNRNEINCILDLYRAGLGRFPRSLMLRFNLIRTALHAGRPQDISEALQLAEETLRMPATGWQLGVMEDVFPYDFESNFFNYRKYLDLVTKYLMQGTSVTPALVRLILASLYYYLGLYKQNPSHLKEAVTLDPDFPFFKLEYARQLVKRGKPGDYEEAGPLLSQLAESSSLFIEAFELLKQLETGGLCRSHRFEELARLVNRARQSTVAMPS